MAVLEEDVMYRQRAMLGLLRDRQRLLRLSEPDIDGMFLPDVNSNRLARLAARKCI